MTLKDLQASILHRLAKAGIESPALDSRLLIQAALVLRPEEFITFPDKPVSTEQKQRLDDYVQRRMAGEPVSKILGQKEFWGLPYTVTLDTLDPRPDTETLIEGVLKRYPADRALHILDLGTGTGCILLSLLHEYKNATGTGVDVSPQALRVAQRNADSLGLDSRATFLLSSWFEKVEGFYDLIVSNPPYIPNPVIPTLGKEVKNFDPILALDGGEDGLEAYCSIIREIKNFLKPGGRAFLEIGLSQADSVARLVDDSALQIVGILPDIGGIPRVVEILHGEK